MTDARRSARIAELNDRFRKDPLRHGRLMITAGVRNLGDDSVQRVLRTIAQQDNIPAGDDPYGERDFAAFDVDDARIFWKIDYYDLTCTFGSEDPSDPAQTVRVMTVMLAEEY